jgi:hypothetical protein
MTLFTNSCAEPDYLSGDGAAKGEEHLDNIESLAAEIILILGPKMVGDAYRRDLSAFTTEQQLAEFACELSVCTALSRIATRTTLRPPIKDQQKRPDAKVEISGREVFVEVKRYSDDGPGPDGRTIALSKELNPSVKPSKPRMMALVSKLESVPDQLPDGAVNLLFVFHPGYGENQKYIQQALFGEDAFFDDPDTVALGDQSLFAEDAWRKVSAVAYVRVADGVLHCHELWPNPRASVVLPDNVQVAIRNLG